MKRYLESVKSFLVPSICFIIVLFLVKTFELFSAEASFSHLAEMILSNTVASLILSLCIFIIFNIISIFSKKAALYISAVLFSIIVISEIGLIFYHNSTGLVMGRELIERPLRETVVTMISVMRFWMIVVTLLFISGSIFVVAKLAGIQKSKCHSNWGIAAMILLMTVSIPVFVLIQPDQNENAVNKIWYCFHSCFLDKEVKDVDIVLSKLEFDNEKIEMYKSIFPDRQISNTRYPLERKDNINNVLGPYFKESKKQPNIVFIVVESLGADLFGINDYGYTFTPFLDSLSQHSLLWTNCLSTTPRSFGVVPAITGSVPHGTKGFQFGNIPEYNSLISILRNNDYETNAFYAGEYSFDKVYDYLVSQNIDFLAPLHEDQKKKENKNLDYTYWGYQDKPMFDKSMEIMEQRDNNKSHFDLLITISQHDNRLKLNDKQESDYYYSQVSEVISSLPESEQAKKNEISGHLAAMLYGDAAIKDFVKKYSELYKDGNYIFVITGDHSLNLTPDNPLDAFHVPLIIWSPLLKKSEQFNSVVSHNDIAPTLNALLRDNYNLKTPKEVHWVGESLDTIKDFHCDLKTCFLRYTRTIFDGIFENYYYTTKNYKKKAFYIKDKLQLEEVNDEEIIKNINEKFNALVYADNYSYTNNQITKNPLFPHAKFKVIKEFVIDSIYCKTNAEKPSEKKPKNVEILSTKIYSHFNEIKIVMTADVVYTGRVWQDQFINLGINLTHDNDLEINNYDDISKNFVGKEHHPNKPIKLEFTRVFSVKDFDDNNFEIYLKPTAIDYLWNPEHSVTLKNINVKILGN